MPVCACACVCVPVCMCVSLCVGVNDRYTKKVNIYIYYKCIYIEREGERKLIADASIA